MNTTKKTARSSVKTGSASKRFSDEERAAMKQRAKELKASEEDGESLVLARIAEMAEPDRSTARRIYGIVTTSAPSLTPRLWYGMPAFYKEGKLICHFQDAHKFKTRYPTLGFSDKAQLDDGNFWPVAYAIHELTPAVEARIGELVKKAAR